MTAFALSAVLVWVAQFHHLREFGLYEDDYWFISEAMGKDFSYVVNRFYTAFTTLPQGRPFGFFLPDLLSFIGDRLGGLSGIYVLGFAVVSLNTYLCYRLLRSRTPVAPAAVGAAIFCLFPADTTKILLTHDFQLQPSLTFALIAALVYMTGLRRELHAEQHHPASRWRPLAYLISAGALLSYENGFLALFGLPLFARPWDRRTPRELIRHVLMLIGVVIVVVVLRLIVGERRAIGSTTSLVEILPPLLGSLILGPVRSLAGMFYGPFKAIPTWDLETLLAVTIAVVGFGILLWRAGSSAKADRTRDALELTAAGAVMLVLAYGLAFTHFPPNALVGRGTSVHLGATLGMAVIAAGLTWLALSLRPRLAVAGVTAYLALAVGYYVTIERDFMRSWQLQRAFWQQVAACCSDVQDGTVLIYELNASDEPTFIFTNSWADPLVLSETFAFPKDWLNPPRLFSLTAWQDRVEVEGDHLRWWVPGASWDEHWEAFPQDNVILLRRDGAGGLQRVTSPVTVAGHTLDLKAPGKPMAWSPAQLYTSLLGQ